LSAESTPSTSLSSLSGSAIAKLLVTLLCSAAAITLRIQHVHIPPLEALFLFGGAVLSAAFILAWAAEALQVDIAKGLAMAVLAFIAVLPEYAVDLYFASMAAKNPVYAQYAAANMTGSNRLLIGVGWSVVALCSVYAALKKRDPNTPKDPSPGVTLGEGYGIDLVILGAATLWSLTMPLFEQIALWNGAGLLAAVCVLRLAGVRWCRLRARADRRRPRAGQSPKVRRRTSVALLLLVAGGTLIAAAEPFAEALIGTGERFGVDRFLLVQWLAPLASEAPELLVAIIFALHGHGSAGMAALLSSKVNQWTLLVGTLPIAYSVALGKPGALHLDARQVGELVLTSLSEPARRRGAAQWPARGLGSDRAAGAVPRPAALPASQCPLRAVDALRAARDSAVHSLCALRAPAHSADV
jgi:cation:H+ antiporter